MVRSTKKRCRVGPAAIAILVVAVSSPLWVFLAPRAGLSRRPIGQAAIAIDLVGAVLAPDVTPQWSVASMFVVIGVCLAAALACWILLNTNAPAAPRK